LARGGVAGYAQLLRFNMDGLGSVQENRVASVRIMDGNRLDLDLLCQPYLLQKKDQQSYLILDLWMDGDTFLHIEMILTGLP
jgi:hypothetical protein